MFLLFFDYTAVPASSFSFIFYHVRKQCKLMRPAFIFGITLQLYQAVAYMSDYQVIRIYQGLATRPGGFVI